MKTPAELAAILRERLIHSRPHYDINGRPLRTIVVTQEWLEDMADAANALDAAPVAEWAEDWLSRGMFVARLQALEQDRHLSVESILALLGDCDYLASLSAAPAASVAQVCTYPNCNCPFDAPADPDWCARGLPHATPATQGCGINKF